MYINNYIPKEPEQQDLWFKNLAGKLPQYSTLLSISTAEINAMQAASNMISYSLLLSKWFKTETAKREAYRLSILGGEIGSIIGAYPVFTIPPTAPATVPGGLIKTTARFVKRVTNTPGYNESIGEDLGIIPKVSPKKVKANAKPLLRISMEAGHPVIKWAKNNMEILDLYVDRKDGKGMVLLSSCNRAKYKDVAELPSVLTSWTYKGVYRNGDTQMGQPSDPISISVENHLVAGSTPSA